MEKYVYHGSSKGNIEALKPAISTHMKGYVYATSSPIIALIFAVESLGDLDHDLRIVDGKVILTERRKGAFDKYKNGGYLYTLDGNHFKSQEGLWEGEVVSENEENILSCEHIPNILDKFDEYVKSGNMIIYRYPDKPEFIPLDDSDLVDKYIGYKEMGHENAIDNLLAFFPHLKEQVSSKLHK